MTAAELLSVAAFAEGRHAQAFPSFGSERTGAPVVAFCRIDDKPIRTREPVVAPDALVVLDATLVHQVDLFAGLRPDGCVLLNTSRSLEELGIGELAKQFRHERFFTVPATEIAIARIGRPVPNAVLLGGLRRVHRRGVDRRRSRGHPRALRAGPRRAQRRRRPSEAYRFVERDYGREVLRVTAD